jgi:hypothetical protein
VSTGNVRANCAVERALRLTDVQLSEPAVWTGEVVREKRRLLTALPRERSRVADVEVLHDLTAGRFDQLSSTAELPTAARLPILRILGRAATEGVHPVGVTSSIERSSALCSGGWSTCPP